METREGTPPASPFPIRVEGGCTRACRPRPSPSLGPRQPGARGHAAPGTSPPPLGRATPCARDGGTRGHDAPGCPVRAGTPHPGPPFPIRAEGGAPKQGHASARRPRPRLPSCPRHPVRAERGHAKPCRAAGPARSPCACVHRARTPFARHSTT
ncbi:hypothetical protein EDB85DRAFT_2058378 [Lactarius pseudohatsudake]|nr:hypothetical protein EDB85DRAFT_2058378 [Lactarius pseudohatsudake]